MRPVDNRLVLLTGQSARHCTLSAEQEDFLKSIAPADFDIVLSGWPYHPHLLGEPYEPPSLVAASIRNAAQEARTLAVPRYRTYVAATIQPIVAATRRKLVIVTGSCGLELLNAAGIADWADLTVIALGPVCIRPLRIPSCKLHALRGRRDFWSRMLYRHTIDAECGCGHLDYYADPEVRDIAKAWLADAN
jgi:hypothetical protein